VDAMPNGGAICIRAEERTDNVILSFEDEGTGIPQENLARVFDPFFSTKGERGTGMGLSIAHGVMRRLGGSIGAANRPEAGGAVFTLTFPLAPEPPLEEVARPRPGQRVLVIDDDRDNLEAIGMVLEGLGHEPIVEPSGRGALERLEAGERYDLVLCDVGMPEMSGWEVAEQIRTLASNTVVYMVTGWAHEIARDDPRRALVAGVLPKPLGIHALEKLLARTSVH
jgi:CheY-like chemotaxis protein